MMSNYRAKDKRVITYKPKEEIINDWLAALRSGQYQQGKHRLTRIYPDGSEKHCCLGVLCKLLGFEREVTQWSDEAEAEASYKGNDGFLYSSTLPEDLNNHLDNITTCRLMELNDVLDAPFTKIADEIEQMVRVANDVEQIKAKGNDVYL